MIFYGNSQIPPGPPPASNRPTVLPQNSALVAELAQARQVAAKALQAAQQLQAQVKQLQAQVFAITKQHQMLLGFVRRQAKQPKQESITYAPATPAVSADPVLGPGPLGPQHETLENQAWYSGAENEEDAIFEENDI